MLRRERSALRALLGEPAALTVAKVVNRLNALTRRFIELSPFLFAPLLNLDIG